MNGLSPVSGPRRTVGRLVAGENPTQAEIVADQSEWVVVYITDDLTHPVPPPADVLGFMVQCEVCPQQAMLSVQLDGWVCPRCAEVVPTADAPLRCDQCGDECPVGLTSRSWCVDCEEQADILHEQLAEECRQEPLTYADAVEKAGTPIVLAKLWMPGDEDSPGFAYTPRYTITGPGSFQIAVVPVVPEDDDYPVNKVQG